MATVKENLIAAKALIDTPEKWSQDAGMYGKCYCIVTSLGAGLDLRGRDYDAAERPLLVAGNFANTRELIAFNDALSTTHADIMALFDRAIAAQDDQL